MPKEWDKKTSYCLQNTFFEEGVKFYYTRMLIQDIVDSEAVYKTLENMGATIKFGTFSRIDGKTIKCAFTFTVTNSLDKPQFIKDLEKTKAKPATEWEEDIIFLADGYGFSPEYPILGYLTQNPRSIHTMILVGGLWYRLISSMDNLLPKDGTDMVMHNAGKDQGSHMAGGLADMFKVPKNVNDENFETSITKLFRAYGYCDIDKIEIDKDKNKVTKIYVHHSAFSITNFITDDIIHMENTRKCHFQLGIFDGFFSTRLGSEHVFEEIECIGEGKDKCIFEILAY